METNQIKEVISQLTGIAKDGINAITPEAKAIAQECIQQYVRREMFFGTMLAIVSSLFFIITIMLAVVFYRKKYDYDSRDFHIAYLLLSCAATMCFINACASCSHFGNVMAPIVSILGK